MTSYLSFGSGPSLILGHGMAQNKKSWIETGWVDRLSSVRTVHVSILKDTDQMKEKLIQIN